ERKEDCLSGGKTDECRQRKQEYSALGSHHACVDRRQKQGGNDRDAEKRPPCVNALNGHVLRGCQDNLIRQFEQVGARRYKAYPNRRDNKDFEKVVHDRSMIPNLEPDEALATRRLRRSPPKALRDGIQYEPPAIAMPPPHLVIGQVAVAKREACSIAFTLKSQGDPGLQAACGLRDPGMLDARRAIQYDETTVVRPIVSLELDEVIEQSVDDGLDNRSGNAEPRAPRPLGVEPNIVHFRRRRRHQPRQYQLGCLESCLSHDDFLLAEKCCSSRSS